ncbi:hypothetical protein RFM41_14880 [Mesorhizobium sp. VK25A]|uniref:Uncharacterized protein n=1 Tax=Mesorhizobium vachelliae TaxID=3072309 RepID=A0ABU5A922_9HYPH|nr:MULTISPECIES: hypothetical protein [unclassified Mesorhizobium]MDX8533112.1 hypothetical protein [Mesorhizobium sp. VK25D]MDX8545031.1 hypothetical protein [Mesorhizobium sp. VK25A]
MNAGGFMVRVSRGGLHVSAEDYERYFQGISGIILIRRDSDLLILPVRLAQAGGYLLKRKNLAGDRVAHAPDFFRANGVRDDDEQDIEVIWDAVEGGLIGRGALSAY